MNFKQTEEALLRDQLKFQRPFIDKNQRCLEKKASSSKILNLIARNESLINKGNLSARQNFYSSLSGKGLYGPGGSPIA